MSEGYIKLYRKVLDNPITCKDADYFSVWIYLLLNATHKEYDALFKGKRITLQKGQLITGTISISKKMKINKDKVQRILKSFENDKQITQQTSNKNRLISILNWNEYQDFDKQIDKQVINNCETTDKQLITNNNVKNDNNINNKKEKINKKEKKKIYDDVFSEFSFSEELIKALKDFIDMRKTIKKPMTTRALELLIKNLEKLTNLEDEKIAILNQSIEHCWQTVYPLKDEEERKKYAKIKQDMKQEKLNEVSFDTSILTKEEYNKLLRKEMSKEELKQIAKERTGEKNVL